MENQNDNEEESACERSAMTPEEEQMWREQCLVKPAEVEYQAGRDAIENGDSNTEQQAKLDTFLGQPLGFASIPERPSGLASSNSDYQRKYDIETSGRILGQCRNLLLELRSWSRKSRDLSLAITNLEQVEDRIRRDRADLFGKPY